MNDPLQTIESDLSTINWKRGIVTILISLIGAALLLVWIALSPDINMPGAGYFQAWAGACFRIASGAYGGYWISRGLLRIDLSQVASRFTDQSLQQSIAVGFAQFARALVVGACILAVVLAT